MAGRWPSAISLSANQSTIGVFPVPPTVRLPTLITVPSSRLLPQDSARGTNPPADARPAPYITLSGQSASRSVRASPSPDRLRRSEQSRQLLDRRGGGPAMALDQCARRLPISARRCSFSSSAIHAAPSSAPEAHLRPPRPRRRNSRAMSRKFSIEGAEHRRFAERRRLQRIVPSGRHQRSAHKHRIAPADTATPARPGCRAAARCRARPVRAAAPPPTRHRTATARFAESPASRPARSVPPLPRIVPAGAAQAPAAPPAISPPPAPALRAPACSSPAITLPAISSGPRADRSRLRLAASAPAHSRPPHPDRISDCPSPSHVRAARPSATTRRASSSLCIRYRLPSANTRRRKPSGAQRANPRNERSEIRPLAYTTGTRACRAVRRKLGQISVSITTISPGRTARNARRIAPGRSSGK